MCGAFTCSPVLTSAVRLNSHSNARRGRALVFSLRAHYLHAKHNRRRTPRTLLNGVTSYEIWSLDHLHCLMLELYREVSNAQNCGFVRHKCVIWLKGVKKWNCERKKSLQAPCNKIFWAFQKFKCLFCIAAKPQQSKSLIPLSQIL